MLALALGGRTIAEWQAFMSQEEFNSWAEFHRRFPFDDESRLFRPAALVANAIAGADMDDLMSWLRNEVPATAGFSEADLATMKAFGVKPPRRN